MIAGLGPALGLLFSLHAIRWIDSRVPETNSDQTQYEDVLSGWEWVYLASCSAVLIVGLLVTSALSGILSGRQQSRFSGRAGAIEGAYWAGVLCVTVVTGGAVHLFWGTILAPLYVLSFLAFVWFRSRQP